MAKVLYKQGTKATYLGLTTRTPNALYWCTDTRELFKGDDLYTDGVRRVDTFSSLPPFTAAAEGKLYYCEDTGSGYVLNGSRDGWDPVVHGVDEATIQLNSAGLMAVKSVPITSVTGLEARLENLENGAAGTPSSGPTAGLKPIAQADINTAQFEIDDNNVLNIKNVDSGIVSHHGRGLDEALPRLYEHRNYEIVDSVFDDTVIDYRDGEIRVMFAPNSPFTLQNVGSDGNPNAYYMGFRSYAPDNAVGFKAEPTRTISSTTELQSMTGNRFVGTDEFGRRYFVAWLSVALYDPSTATWHYRGSDSTNDNYVGWYCSLEWYDAANKLIGANTVRVNLTNQGCHANPEPYCMHGVNAAIAWQDI